jgi:hypothetical protein
MLFTNNNIKKLDFTWMGKIKYILYCVHAVY